MGKGEKSVHDTLPEDKESSLIKAIKANKAQKTTISGKGRGGGSVPQKALAAVAGRVPCRGVKTHSPPPKNPTKRLEEQRLGWHRFQRNVASWYLLYGSLGVRWQLATRDAYPLDNGSTLPAVVAAYAGALFGYGCANAGVLGVAVKWQISRKLGALLGEPRRLELSNQSEQVAATAAAAQAHPDVSAAAAAEAAGSPAPVGLPLVSIYPRGRLRDGSFVDADLPVRGALVFQDTQHACFDQLLLSQGDLLALAQRLEQGTGLSASSHWNGMIQALEAGGVGSLDDYIAVTFWQGE